MHILCVVPQHIHNTSRRTSGNSRGVQGISIVNIFVIKVKYVPNCNFHRDGKGVFPTKKSLYGKCMDIYIIYFLCHIVYENISFLHMFYPLSICNMVNINIKICTKRKI